MISRMLAEATFITTDMLGKACALGTAILWGLAVVLFKMTGERTPPLSLNLYKNAVGIVLLFATLAIMIAIDPTEGRVLQEHPGDLCILALSGVIGIAIADTIFFYALNLIGVGLISIVDCAYSPFVILFAAALLCEQLALPHYVGAGLIVVGVFVASRHKLPVGRTRGQIVFGMSLAVVAVSMMAFGIVIAKPIIEGMSLVWATTVRMVGGTVFLALFALLGRNWRTHWHIFKPTPHWRIALPASVLGTYICMILWVAGFKYTNASVAGVLNQTSVVFAAVFAVFLIREEFGPRKIAALSLSLTGVIIVTLDDVFTQWCNEALAFILRT